MRDSPIPKGRADRAGAVSAPRSSPPRRVTRRAERVAGAVDVPEGGANVCRARAGGRKSGAGWSRRVARGVDARPRTRGFFLGTATRATLIHRSSSPEHCRPASATQL